MGLREDDDDDTDDYVEDGEGNGYLRNKEGRWIVGSMLDNVNGLSDFLRVHETLGKAEIRRLKGPIRNFVDSEDSAEDSDDLRTDVADVDSSVDEDDSE